MLPPANRVEKGFQVGTAGQCIFRGVVCDPDASWVDKTGNPRHIGRVARALGEYLRSLRQKRGVGLKGAAPKVGVSYTYLSKI
ncbi:MAG TPA: helix-turn-helix transcriptional regulator, partial [Polyangia bacterium]|nr:helix-turn-helix transcriptional regulator [Polyangia bacterium]